MRERERNRENGRERESDRENERERESDRERGRQRDRVNGGERRWEHEFNNRTQIHASEDSEN